MHDYCRSMRASSTVIGLEEAVTAAVRVIVHELVEQMVDLQFSYSLREILIDENKQ